MEWVEVGWGGAIAGAAARLLPAARRWLSKSVQDIFEG
jgi:hypothetical protein